tara:strand:- start:315 stop:839 length:525 start_codon:yes stop_codon:yes gene_type:complete
MNKYKEIFDSIFRGGIIGGFATFILNLITISYWQRDGFDFLEIALMTIMAGLFLFISTLSSNIYFLNNGIRNALKADSSVIKRTYQVLLSLIIAMLVFLMLDAIFFITDDSIAQDYAYMLKEMTENNGDTLPGFDDYASLPFGIQNAILTFIIGLLGSLISLAFVKKDGQLLKK